MKRTFALLAFLVLPAIIDAQPADTLPPRAFLRIGTTKLRHGDRILSLAYSPDGSILAAGGGNDPLRIWNPKTGDLVQAINEPWVSAMTFTPSGQTLIFAGYQRSIRLWNFQLGKENGRLDGHKSAIKALAVSPDTTTIASGSQDGLICLWNMENKRKVIELTGHTDEVTALAFSPIDSNLFASAGSDRVIHLWSVETNEAKIKIDAGCSVFAIAFSPDGKTLFSAGDDHLIRRWDVANGKPKGVFKGHGGIVVSLIANKDTLISGSLDRTIRFWDPATTEQRKSLPRAHGDCDALAAPQAGDFVATAGINNTVRIFETASGKEVIRETGAQAALVGLATSRDRKRLAAVTSDGQVLIWETATGQLHKHWDSKQSGELVLALAPDGKSLVTAANGACLWTADTGAEIARWADKPVDPIVALAYSPDGNTLAVGHRASTIELWEANGKKRVGKFQYEGGLHALAWSPDGKKLAAAGGPKVFVWNPQTETLLKSFPVKEGPPAVFPTIRTLAFGPDSNALAAGGWDAMIRIYQLTAKNPSETREQRVCEGHTSAVFSVAFSPDGRSLVSGSFDRTVRLWETFSGKQIAQFKGHAGEVSGVAFQRDGRSVYSASSDATILAWDVPGLSNNGKVPDLTLGIAELDGAWTAMASEETARGHEMLWRCVASSKQAVPHLAGKVFLLEPEHIKKLFRDLDSARFPTRIAAEKELADPKYGRWMEGRYDEAIVNAQSLEYRRRVEGLKEKLNENKALPLVQERLRLRRFMLLCEQVGNADAIDALQKLAAKGPEEDLRDEANVSLQRLKK